MLTSYAARITHSRDVKSLLATWPDAVHSADQRKDKFLVIPLPDDFGPELKECRRCETCKPLDEFGLNTANILGGDRDGKNINCKLCTRITVATQRAGLREYKAARESRKTPAQYNLADAKTSRRIARMLRKLSPADRVREAIRCGAHTQKEIAQVTKLPKDEVCDALANLLLWSKTIRTRMVRHQRMYFVNEDRAAGIQREPIRPREPARSYGVSNIYESGEPEIRGMSTKYLRNK